MVADELGKRTTLTMSYLVYIHGLSGAGFRIPKPGGGYQKCTENGTVQVDLDDIRTQLILNGERDNFVRVAASGATTVTITGLTRKGFRIPESSDGLFKIVKVGNSVTVDLTKGTVRRILRRSYGRYISTTTPTTFAIRGTVLAQNGFDVVSPSAAFATVTSDGTVPAAGDTITIHDKTYRFETTLALANDVKIGATSDATLDNLVLAVNQTGVAGTNYFAGTTAPTGVTAAARVGSGNGANVTFTATTPGTAGNAFTSTETSAHLSFTAATFVGGSALGATSKVFRGQSVTVDATQEVNYTRIRRLYQRWLEA